MNYYKILEVRDDASKEVISMAYKALARKYHPDVYKGNKDEANHFMSLINEAYSVLSDAEKRRNYDNLMRATYAQSFHENQKNNYTPPKQDSNTASWGTITDRYLQSIQKFLSLCIAQKGKTLAIAIIILATISVVTGDPSSDDSFPNENLSNNSIVASGDELTSTDDDPNANVSSIKTQMDNFDTLAIFFGYSDYNKFIAAETRKDSSMPTTLSEQYQFIAIKYANVGDYNSLIGTYNPYTESNIETFEDYQNFVYFSTLKSTEQPYPANGQILHIEDKIRCSPLTVETNSALAYYIKLVPLGAENEEQFFAFFITPGSTANVDVPVGDYWLKYATGSTWYGSTIKFGPEMRTYKASDVFTFTESEGWTVTLIEQENGNLATDEISSDSF